MSKQTTETIPTLATATVNTKAFAAELEWVNRFTESKRTIPILSTVLLSKVADTLTLTATDLQVGGITQVPCGLGDDFKVCVPVRGLLKYLAEVEEPEVSLSVPAGRLVFTMAHGSDGVVEIHGMNADMFPELPKPVLEGVLSGLRLAVPRAIVAVSEEESRFTLNGALLDVREGARIIATDGHRLSLSAIESKDIADCRKLVPLGCLKELAALGEDAYHFGYDENHLFFLSQCSMRRIVSRVLTGNFPDHERVMPSSFASACKIDQAAMAKAQKRVMLFADDRSRAYTYELDHGAMQVSAQMVEDGGAKSRVPASWQGEPFKIGFNGRYVQQFLDLCPPGDLDFKFNAPDKAGEFSTPGWRYLIMPMRI